MTNSTLLFLVGALAILLGFVNWSGDLTSFRTYRANVAPEDEKPFGRLSGAGMVFFGIAAILYGLFPANTVVLYFAAACLAGGIGLTGYAEVKYCLKPF